MRQREKGDIICLPSMPRFIPGHKRENLCYHWIGFLQDQSSKQLKQAQQYEDKVLLIQTKISYKKKREKRERKKKKKGGKKTVRPSFS
jgi:hypothetical protein